VRPQDLVLEVVDLGLLGSQIVDLGLQRRNRILQALAAGL